MRGMFDIFIRFTFGEKDTCKSATQASNLAEKNGCMSCTVMFREIKWGCMSEDQAKTCLRNSRGHMLASYVRGRFTWLQLKSELRSENCMYLFDLACVLNLLHVLQRYLCFKFSFIFSFFCPSKTKEFWLILDIITFYSYWSSCIYL